MLCKLSQLVGSETVQNWGHLVARLLTCRCFSVTLKLLWLNYTNCVCLQWLGWVVWLSRVGIRMRPLLLVRRSVCSFQCCRLIVLAATAVCQKQAEGSHGQQFQTHFQLGTLCLLLLPELLPSVPSDTLHSKSPSVCLLQSQPLAS